MYRNGSLKRKFFCSLHWQKHSKSCQPLLNDQSRHMQINKTIKTGKIEDSDAFFKVASPEYACVDKSIIHVTAHERRAPINKLSRSQTLKTQQVESFTHPRKTSKSFSRHRPGRCVCARENLDYLSSFAKLSVSVKSIIPWQSVINGSQYYLGICRS